MTLTADTFEFVVELVHRESAIVIGPDKGYLVESRLTPLANSAGADNIDDYVASSRGSVARKRDIVEALTTNETSWFRDNEPFRALHDVVLPELAESRQVARHLRIWSAACSSGQEPYSIAMTILDTPALTGWRTSIIGTDLSEEMVERCRGGRYSQLEVNRGLPATSLVRHFVRDGLVWKVSPELSRMTTFQTGNLIRPFGLPGQFDVIFLRNVLIYFDLPTKRDILRRVRQVLAPHGFLFLGAAETTIGIDDSFERVPAGRAAMYRPKKAAS
jgi:chemotaxis protein methyltransferase CheR